MYLVSLDFAIATVTEIQLFCEFQGDSGRSPLHYCSPEISAVG
ncbi:MAG: hypothetical protein ACFCBU_06320 [Cyanophyceae cyanobacterium]